MSCAFFYFQNLVLVTELHWLESTRGDKIKKYLVNHLRVLRTNRQLRYSNSAYIALTDDYSFSNVPAQLDMMWYSPDTISVITQSVKYYSDYARMSNEELVKRICCEWMLLLQLQIIFATLKQKKK